jgi:hypothetical protein
MADQIDQDMRMTLHRIADALDSIKHSLASLVSGPSKAGGGGRPVHDASLSMLKLLERIAKATEGKAKE